MKELSENALNRFNEWRSACADLLLYGKPMPSEQDNALDELITLIRTATLDEVEYAGLESCLSEAIDLVEDIVKGDYTPDSFTTQPWRKAINNMTSIDSLRGSDD